jgi:DNA helicase-2/ATP-dependent DNA helicase PcrA
LRDLIGALCDDPIAHRPAAQIETVLSSSYADYVRATYSNAEMRLEDLRQLAHFAARYSSTEQFLSDVALLGQERFSMRDGLYGEDRVGGAEGEDDYLILSSIHQAKGLEWRSVFLIWAAEGRFPTTRAVQDPEALEEERRLFYVALTRAKDELYICYPLIAREGSRTILLRPSRFITEVEPELFETWVIESA